MTNLIVIDEYTVDVEEQEESLLANILLTEKQTRDILSERLDIEHRINSMFDHLSRINPQLKEWLDKLQQELSELLLKQHVEFNEPPQPEVEFNEPTPDVHAEPKRNPQKHHLKTLYRKIAHKTHPDKTSNKELHAIYVQARKLYESSDLEGLKLLWSMLVNKRSRKHELKHKLLRLQEDLSKEFQILCKIKSSGEYAMLRDFNSIHKPRVVQHHIKLMSAKIESLISAIQRFDHTRYKDPINIQVKIPNA